MKQNSHIPGFAIVAVNVKSPSSRIYYLEVGAGRDDKSEKSLDLFLCGMLLKVLIPSLLPYSLVEIPILGVPGWLVG